jgi:hypothetical protein
MAIAEADVEAVVQETLVRMADAGFTQLAVAAFVQAQPHLCQYIGSRAPQLGGGDAVLQLLFHGSVIAECFRRATDREPPVVPLKTLDLASQGALFVRLTEREPALASYVASNTDSPVLREELARVGLAFSILSARRSAVC